MAIDKLVDSGKLNNALSYTAGRIRAKTGGSSQIAFDFANEKGFGDAVDAIPTGGTPTGTKQISITQNGTTTEDVAAYASAEITVNVQGGGGADTLTDFLDNTLTSITYTGTVPLNKEFARNKTALLSVSLPNVTEIPEMAFNGCSNLTTFSAPKVTTIGNNALQTCKALTGVSFPLVTYVGTYVFGDNYALSGTLFFPVATQVSNYFVSYAGRDSGGITVVLPSLVTLGNDGFRNCICNAIDLGESFSALPQRGVYLSNAAHKCDALILRKKDGIVTANSNQSVYRSNGGSIVIYVPSALKATYEADSTWNSILSSSYISMTTIEGSQYETHYADGTVIPT